MPCTIMCEFEPASVSLYISALSQSCEILVARDASYLGLVGLVIDEAHYSYTGILLVWSTKYDLWHN